MSADQETSPATNAPEPGPAPPTPGSPARGVPGLSAVPWRRAGILIPFLILFVALSIGLGRS